MPSITYTALRSVQPGHTIGLNYSFDFQPMQLDASTNTVANVSKSISGKVQHVIEHRDKLIDVVTDYYATSEAMFLNFREFLESVDEFETFTFDRYGTVASPVDPKQVELTQNYKSERLSVLETYRFVFSFREIL